MLFFIYHLYYKIYRWYLTQIWAVMIMATIGKWIKMENIWYSTTYKIPYLYWSKYITWDWLCLSLHRVKNLWNTCLSHLVWSSQYAFSYVWMDSFLLQIEYQSDEFENNFFPCNTVRYSFCMFYILWLIFYCFESFFLLVLEYIPKKLVYHFVFVFLAF